RSKVSGSTRDAEESIATFRAACELIKLRPADTGRLEGHACNSLGAALMDMFWTETDDASSEETLREAYRAFRRTMDVSEVYSDADTWGASRYNIGFILSMQANRKDLSLEERQFLRVRAVVEFGAALETFPVTLFSRRGAEAQFRLAN